MEILYYYFFEQVFYTLAIFKFLFKYIDSGVLLSFALIKCQDQSNLQKEGFIRISASRGVRVH